MGRKQYIAGEFQWEFLLPKYWKIWIAITFLMLLAILPWSIQWRLAHSLAALCWHLLKSRRKTTLRNLELCFPEWSPAEVEAQAKQNLALRRHAYAFFNQRRKIHARRAH